MKDEFTGKWKDKPRELIGRKYVFIDGRKIEVDLVCSVGAYGRTLVRPLARFDKRYTQLQNLKIENKRLMEENTKLKNNFRRSHKTDKDSEEKI